VQRDELRGLAARQHGLVTRDQALATGMSRTGWYRRLASGVLIDAQPGVAALEGAVPTTEQAVLAVVLSVGPGAVASHRSAAYLWGVEIAGADPVDVIVSRGSAPRRRGAIIHRPLDGRRVHSIPRAGIAATTPVRTLLELGAVCSPREVQDAYDHLLVAGSLTPAAVRAALDRHARKGRAGAGVLRDVVDRWALGDRPPDSVLEAAMARTLLRYRLPIPQFQYEIRGSGFRYRVDFAYPELRVIIEVDGWRHHGSRGAFECDRERDAMLQSCGWTVLRFTWLQISRRPAWVAERIAETLRQRCAAS
jgi:very-short-patch-repair endonuclease